MAVHIPFVTGEEAANLTSKHFSDAEVIRLPLERGSRYLPILGPTKSKIWMDPCVDGCDDIETRRSKSTKANSWFEFMRSLPHFEKLGQNAFIATPIQSEVNSFVAEVMNKCLLAKPAWITVPQLPAVEGTARNKINRALAKATSKWKASSGFKGKLILPVVITHQRQVNKKTDRNPRVKITSSCYSDAGAEGIWVVDKALADESGSPTLRNIRFPGIVAFHEELNAEIKTSLRVAGPYWGMNLILWAKGLVDYPGIGIGSGYQFYLSGGHARPASAKIAVPSLRRRVSVGPALGPWFTAAKAAVGSGHPAYTEFDNLQKRLPVLSDISRAREQVAEFYKHWFDKIAASPATTRKMDLFQDLAAAYALGKMLPEFANEGTARRPEAVAESLMMSCL